MSLARRIDRAAHSAAAALNLTLAVRCTDRPLELAHLSAGERQRFAALATAARRDEWLRGRQALKQLLPIIGLDGDSSRYTPPQPHWSLSHSGGWALAVGASFPPPRGLGVDLELNAAPRAAAARLFLDPGEVAALAHVAPQSLPAVLRRLWSIKEAAFKATPDNRGLGLQDFHVEAPLAAAGTVRCAREPDRAIRCAVREIHHPTRRGCLAVAVSP